MPGKRRLRLVVTIGAVLGAIGSVVISLLMDVLYADALRGTWRDAIASDIQSMFSVQLSPDSLIVYVVFLVILILLGLFGAFLGAVFSMFVYKLITALTK